MIGSKIVLVKNLSSLSEARYCAGMMVDYIGFELNPNHRDYIPENKRLEIMNWIKGPLKLASFTSLTVELFDFESAITVFDGFIFNPSQIDFFLHPLLINKTKILDLTNDTSAKVDFELFDYIISTVLDIGKVDSNKVLIGYDFDTVKTTQNAVGFAFNGTIESQIGANSYDELMDALDVLDS